MTMRKDIGTLKDQFRVIHSDKYDYTQILEYKNNKEPLPIICPKHGLFYQTSNSHLSGHGCPKCANELRNRNTRMTKDVFLRRSKEIHKGFYDYSLVTNDNFVNTHTKVPIICPQHGTFYQTPDSHLGGKGCYKCGKQSMSIKQSLSRDEIVEKLNIIFDNKYDYSLFTDHQNNKEKIKVVCPKHGVWEVSIKNHLYRKSGCPKCKRSLGEERVSRFLDNNNIEYLPQFHIANESLFCDNMTIVADFYLPQQNVIIEYNGEQHYKKVKVFSGKSFDQQQWRDESLSLYCHTHGIRLIVIPYTDFNKIENILRKELKI